MMRSASKQAALFALTLLVVDTLAFVPVSGAQVLM